MSTPNPWFRHYVGMVADPKFGGIARRTRETRERVVFVWSCVLESASHINDNGKFLIDVDVVADLLRCENDSIETILAQLDACGLTEDGAVVKWHFRQYLSDNSTERSRKHRAKKRASGPDRSGNGDATLQDVAGTAGNASATPPESESESESETETDKNPVVVKSSGGCGGTTTTDGLVFFELTPERMAMAQARGFVDMAWVKHQTERFIQRNAGKVLINPDSTWLNWLDTGWQRGFGRGQTLAPAPSYLDSSAAAKRVMV